MLGAVSDPLRRRACAGAVGGGRGCAGRGRRGAGARRRRRGGARSAPPCLLQRRPTTAESPWPTLRTPPPPPRRRSHLRRSRSSPAAAFRWWPSGRWGAAPPCRWRTSRPAAAPSPRPGPAAGAAQSLRASVQRRAPPVPLSSGSEEGPCRRRRPGTAAAAAAAEAPLSPPPPRRCILRRRGCLLPRPPQDLSRHCRGAGGQGGDRPRTPSRVGVGVGEEGPGGRPRSPWCGAPPRGPRRGPGATRPCSGRRLLWRGTSDTHGRETLSCCPTTT